MTSWEFFDYLLGKLNIVGTPGSGFGKNGEYLTGTYVYETENGKTVKLSNPLVKKDDKFTIPED